MGNAERAPGQIISLPQGGGALRGMVEKFAPDLQIGTGNFTAPIAVPVGRRGLEPKLDLACSTGSGNGFFGLGWNVTVPGVSRKTCRGVPTYDDRQDVFLLSGSGNLVPVGAESPTETRYRPRTEGLFARIVHQRGPRGANYWEVTSKDGLRFRAIDEGAQQAGDDNGRPGRWLFIGGDLDAVAECGVPGAQALFSDAVDMTSGPGSRSHSRQLWGYGLRRDR